MERCTATPEQIAEVLSLLDAAEEAITRAGRMLVRDERHCQVTRDALDAAIGALMDARSRLNEPGHIPEPRSDVSRQRALPPQ